MKVCFAFSISFSVSSTIDLGGRVVKEVVGFKSPSAVVGSGTRKPRYTHDVVRDYA